MQIMRYLVYYTAYCTVLYCKIARYYDGGYSIVEPKLL